MSNTTPLESEEIQRLDIIDSVNSQSHRAERPKNLETCDLICVYRSVANEAVNCHDSASSSLESSLK